jgi:hypothetical protein
VTARDRVILLVVLALAAVAGSWVLLIQPQRTQAHNLDTQVAAVQSQLNSARAQVASGLAARSQFAADYAQLAALGEALPQDDNVPSLIYQIQSAASASRVDFRSLVMNSNGSSAPTPTPAPASPGSTPSASPAAAPPALPPGAVIGPAGFPTEQFSFTFEGNFFHLSDFFDRLERFVVANQNHILVSGRLLSLNALTFSPGPNGFPQIQASVGATTYMAPATTGLLNGATPSGPASSTTPASTSTGTSPAPAAITSTIR